MRKLLTSRGLILLALTATVLLSFISYQSVTKLNTLAGLVDHTHVVQLNLQRTDGALSDADSELKAFLLTKDSVYYEKLMKEEARIRKHILKLSRLTQDNDLQKRRVSSLDSLILVRWKFMPSS